MTIDLGGTRFRTETPGSSALKGAVVLGVLLTVAFALRLTLTISFPTVHQPDEVFQTLEPAHRIAFGWGITTWEWRSGIRSWLYPAVLAALMKLSDSPEGSPNYLILIQSAQVVLSLSTVIVAYLTGWRQARGAGALLCGWLAVVWCDVIYFGPKTLTEVVAAHFLIVAVYLSEREYQEAPHTHPRHLRLISLGFLLATVFCIRFHLAPVLLFLAVAASRMRPLKFGMIAIGALPVLVLTGAADWITLGSPFQSIWKNIFANIVEGRSDQFGRYPVYWYAGELIRVWGAAAVIIAVTFLLGVRRAPVFAGSAFLNVVMHTLIAHKELRFLYPSVPMILVVAGLGTLELAALVAEAFKIEFRRLCIAFAGMWTLVSATVFLSGGYQSLWKERSDILRAQKFAAARPDICGLGLIKVPWYATGGYTYFHRNVPISLAAAQIRAQASTLSFNYAIVDRDASGQEPGYEVTQCWTQVCVVRRNGPCTDPGNSELNRALVDLGQ